MNFHPPKQLSKPLRRLVLALTTALLTVLLGLYGWNSVSFLDPATAAVSTAHQNQPPENQQFLAQSAPQQLLQKGREQFAAEQFTEAVNTWSQAERHFANQNDPLNQAITLSNLALAHHQLNQWPEAETAITTSLQLLQSTPELSPQGLRIYGQALNTQGSLYFAQGQTKQALTTWEQATEIYTQADYPKGIIKSLINQTYALRSLGFFRESHNRLEQVEALLVEQPDSPLKIALTRSLGETQRLIGDLNASQTSLEKSLTLANELQRPTEQAATRLSLGKTLQNQAQRQETLAQRTKQKIDYDTAEDQYTQALETYAAIPDTAPLITRLRAQLNQLDISLHRKDWTAAQSLKSSLILDINDLPLGRPSAFIHMRLARLLMDRCAIAGCSSELQISKQQIYGLLVTARNQAQIISDPIAESYALGYLGHLYEQEENAKKQTYTDAQRLTEAALELTRHQPNLAYQWEWQLGRLGEKLQQNQGSVLKHYDDAFQHVQAVRNDLLYIESDIQFNFRDQIEPLYREYISLLLPKETRDIQGDPAQLIRAQKVIDDLRVAELASFLACGLIEPDDDIPRATIQQIANTEKTTAIIYPIILPDGPDADRLEVLLQLPGQAPDQAIKRYASSQVISKDASKASGTNANLSITEEQLEQFRKELEQPFFSTKRGLPLASQIYDWLIRPAEDQGWLESIDTLVFVLDGAFRKVPMAALYDQQVNQFLIQKYAISVTFGDLQLPVASPEQSFRVLAAGLSKDPVPPANASEENMAADIFGPLVYVQDEIQAIEENIEDTRPLLDEAFTPKRVQANMSSSAYNVVHLATHGEFGFTRDATFLLAASGKANPTDQTIEVKRIDLNGFNTILQTRTQTPLELLVLSACETATGDSREVLGIAGLAVQSGARSTLATLWSINDSSAAILMERFYQNLTEQGVSKAKALQQAQLQLLDQGYKPSKWAPYQLVGDWR